MTTTKEGQPLLQLRCEAELLLRLDRQVEKMREEHRGLAVSRASVARIALEAWLAQQEQREQSE